MAVFFYTTATVVMSIKQNNQTRDLLCSYMHVRKHISCTKVYSYPFVDMRCFNIPEVKWDVGWLALK